ncbi:MAG: uridine kinase [Micromonosporaceae bacterium]
MIPQRLGVLDTIARQVPHPVGEDCVRVAIDGVDGAGKTIFADELSTTLVKSGRPVVRICADDFLNPRRVRYRRGRTSPEGYWLDSYDYPALWERVLNPLGPGGDRWYKAGSLDLLADRRMNPSPMLAEPGSVLVLDGMFLHRDELAEVWDFSIFLDVGFSVTAARMAQRDGSHPDPEHPSMARYVRGQRLYLAACDPASRASVVVDHTDPSRPALLTR